MDMYNLQELFDKLDQFKKEASDSSATDGKKGNMAAAKRARALSTQITKDFLQFRKASVAKNV